MQKVNKRDFETYTEQTTEIINDLSSQVDSLKSAKVIMIALQILTILVTVGLFFIIK